MVSFMFRFTNYWKYYTKPQFGFAKTHQRGTLEHDRNRMRIGSRERTSSNSVQYRFP
jgi:hypothetical protein